MGGPAAQAPGTESDDTGPVGDDGVGVDSTEEGAAPEEFDGGLIQRPKRKAKNTKKKRRGLASR